MSCEYARSNGYAFALEKFRAKINEELEKAMEESKKVILENLNFGGL